MTQQAVKDLYEVGGLILQAIGQALRASVAAGVADAKSTTMWKDASGVTRNSIHGEMKSSDTAAIIAGGQSKRLEEGTPQHVIQARNGGFLVFEVGGQTMFRRFVNHPGTAARPFLYQARNHAEQVLDYGLELLIDKATRR